jgi:hypothetical protein
MKGNRRTDRITHGGKWTMLTALVVALAGVGTAGQQPPAGGGGAAARGPAAPPGGAPIAFDDYTGFRKIFDGTSLNGWDGDPRFWRAENGVLVGESTPEKQVNPNTFAIWRGGEPADFELKIEFRINNTNSGVQYRSKERPEIAKWVLSGYQADIDFANQYTGQLYEERGRGFLALRGSVGFAAPGRVGPIGSLENADALKGIVKTNDWNQLHILAAGTTLVHILNGHTTAVFVDEDPANRAAKGLIGLQMHMGAPMKVEYRNIYLKTAN